MSVGIQPLLLMMVNGNPSGELALVFANTCGVDRITDSKSETRPIVKVTEVMIVPYENDGCTFIAFTCNL